MPHFKACCSTWLISVYIKCFEKQKISPQFSSASWWNFSVHVLKNVTLLGRIIFLQWQKQKGQRLSIAVDSEARVTLSSCGSDGFSELDETIKSMMETSQTISNEEKSFKICKPCGKEGQNMAIRDHIEAYHLEGLALPCNNCKRTFRSRYSVEKHKCFESKINLIFFSSRTRLSLRNHKAKMHNIKRC